MVVRFGVRGFRICWSCHSCGCCLPIVDVFVSNVQFWFVQHNATVEVKHIAPLCKLCKSTWLHARTCANKRVPSPDTNTAMPHFPDGVFARAVLARACAPTHNSMGIARDTRNSWGVIFAVTPGIAMRVRRGSPQVRRKKEHSLQSQILKLLYHNWFF